MQLRNHRNRREGVNILVKRRKKVLFQRIKRGIQRKDTVIIGVFGLHSGVGTTHIALLVANYFSDIKNKAVAYLEYSGKDDVRYIQESEEGLEEEDMIFVLRGVHYYRKIKQNELIEVRNWGFDICIIDFGNDLLRAENELMRCDLKFLIGSDAPWRDREFKLLKKISDRIGSLRSWYIIMNLSTDQRKKKSLYAAPIQVFQLPYSKNALLPSENIIRIFDQIFRLQ